MRSAIQDIAVGPDRGRDLTQSHAKQAMDALLNGDCDDVQAAIFLIALRMKRESLDEFSGLLEAMELQTECQIANTDQVVILADPFDGYVRNATMTPFIPCVLSACGLTSVIHGVESVGPKHGVTAHKVFKLAGANTMMSCSQAVTALNQVGCSYVDQSQYSPSLFALNDLRHRMVKRSAVTTLERILMPIRGKKSTHLALGYVHKAYPDIYARMAFQVGFDKVLLFKGVEGGLAPALNKPLRRFAFETVLPASVDGAKQRLDLPLQAKVAAPSMPNQSDPVEAVLDQGLKVLQGAAGLARDSLVIASAQILNGLDKSVGFSEAVEKVQVCLDNGEAHERFVAFIANSNAVADA